MKSLFIGVDFDGTMVQHKYPEIGEPLENAVEVLEKLQVTGHKIILYTMRSGERLVQAVEYMEENDIELYAVNENPTQKHWTQSPKIFCHIYIDDAGLGIPLDEDNNGDRPVVDWYEVEDLLKEKGLI